MQSVRLVSHCSRAARLDATWFPKSRCPRPPYGKAHNPSQNKQKKPLYLSQLLCNLFLKRIFSATSTNANLVPRPLSTRSPVTENSILSAESPLLTLSPVWCNQFSSSRIMGVYLTKVNLLLISVREGKCWKQQVRVI